MPPTRIHFLGRRGSCIVPFRFAEENIFELVHSRVDEKQSGVVVGDDRGRRDDGVSLLFEVIQKRSADFLGEHNSSNGSQ